MDDEDRIMPHTDWLAACHERSMEWKAYQAAKVPNRILMNSPNDYDRYVEIMKDVAGPKLELVTHGSL